jgi:hypothetical protein
MAKKYYQTEADRNLMYALIVLVLVMVLFWTIRYGAKNYYAPPVQQPKQTVETGYPVIESSSDLDKASAELDNTDLNAIDKELNSLDSDASSF